MNCEHDAIGNMAVAFVGTSGVQMGWLASQADMLADDWMFVDDRTLHCHKRRRQACTELAGEPDQLQDNQIIIPGQRRTRRVEGGEDWR